MITIFSWPGRLLYLGPAVDTAEHAHYAHQITVALNGCVAFALADGRELRAGAVVIPAMCSHMQRGEGALVASLYVDGRFGFGCALSQAPRSLSQVSLPSVGAECSVDEACRFETAVRDAVDLPMTPRAWSARTRRIVERLNQARPHFPTLTELAREHDLSVSRLTHRLSSELGIPYRTYILWRRLQVAPESVSAPGSLTLAAHDAGFSDAPHLSRTFRRMFGLAPSEALQGVRFVHVDDG